MITTTDFIREMREMCEKATPGPWKYWPLLSGSENHRGYKVAADTQVAEVFPLDQDGTEGGHNAVFIAHARTALPEALDRLEASEKEMRRAVKALIAEEDVSKIYRTALEQIKNLPVTVFGTAAVLEACEDLHCLIVQIIDKALREAEEG